MNYEALDAPALVLPRVLDVHGTLRRLGFKGFTSRRQSVNFYRWFVPLFDGGIESRFSARRVSHASFLFNLEEDGFGGHMWVAYGFPQRRPHGGKIVESFQPLISEKTHEHFSFSNDSNLREFEKTITMLTNDLMTKRVDCVVERDSETGVVLKTIPEYEALPNAVGAVLCSKKSRDEGEWFEIYDPGPDPKAEERIVPSSRYTRARLPNFDRRRDIRGRIGRPVGVNR